MHNIVTKKSQPATRRRSLEKGRLRMRRSALCVMAQPSEGYGTVERKLT